MEIEFNFNKLRGRIKEKYKTQIAFSSDMGFNEATLSNKLNNNVEFTSKEILKASKLLNIEKNLIPEYFFTQKVQETEQN